MTSTSTDIPEPTTVDGERAMRVASHVTLLVALLYAAGLLVSALRVTPARLAAFDDIGKSLPPITMFFLGSEFPLWCGAIAVGALAKEWLVRRPRVTLVLNGALLVLTEALKQAWVVAANLPLLDLLMGMK